MYPKNFSPIFSKKLAFLEKIVKWKNIQNLVFHKKDYIHFRPRTNPSLWLVPQKLFFAIFSENTAFFWKNGKQWIIQCFICNKKSHVNFGNKTPPFSKHSNMTQNSFSLKKKLLKNELFSISFVIKKVMLILGTRRLFFLNNQMWPKTVFHCFLGKYCYFRQNYWIK